MEVNSKIYQIPFPTFYGFAQQFEYYIVKNPGMFSVEELSVAFQWPLSFIQESLYHAAYFSGDPNDQLVLTHGCWTNMRQILHLKVLDRFMAYCYAIKKPFPHIESNIADLCDHPGPLKALYWEQEETQEREHRKIKIIQDLNKIIETIQQKDVKLPDTWDGLRQLIKK